MGSTFAAWRWLIEPARQSDGESRPPVSLGKEYFAIFAPRFLVGTFMLWLLFVCMLTMNYCLFSWLPTMLVDVGREPSVAATSVSIFSLGGIIAALGVGLLIDKFGATRVLVSFLAVAAGLLFVVGQIMADASTTLLLALLGFGGFFFLGAYGGVNVVLTSYYPDWLCAIGIGWTKTVGRIGTIIAPIMIGYALDAGMAQTSIMSLSAMPILVAASTLVIIALVSRKHRDTPDTPPIVTVQTPTQTAANS
jgi:MFS family permease